MLQLLFCKDKKKINKDRKILNPLFNIPRIHFIICIHYINYNIHYINYNNHINFTSYANILESIKDNRVWNDLFF